MLAAYPILLLPGAGASRPGVFASALLMALAGCAANVPQAIRTVPANPLTVAQVQQDQARYPGRPVRWGGTIIAVKNLPDSTEVEVLNRPLDADGAPRTAQPGAGRFIARVAGFLDPAEYEKERALTVAGTLVGTATRPVGEYRYAYPVVKVDTRYLWPKSPPPGVYDPYGYPGWYGPWGPWGPWNPWYGPPGYYHRPGRGPWRR